MLIIGLTGSIGMGKSTAATHFKALGIGVFDADAAVHTLYAGRAVSLIEAAFPGTTNEGGVDRAKLAAVLGSSGDQFKRLEALIHPLVRQAEREFLLVEHELRATFAVLEVPLLFETGGHKRVDAAVVLSTDVVTQRARVMARAGMTVAKFEALLARQMSDADKRAKADFVVDTTGPVTDTQAQINQVLTQLAGRAATAFHRHWETA